MARLDRDLETLERLLQRLRVLELVLCHLLEALRDRDLAGRSCLFGEQRVRHLDLAVLVQNRGADVVGLRSDESGELPEFREMLLQLDGCDSLEHRSEPRFSSPARRSGEQEVPRVRHGFSAHRRENVVVRLGVHLGSPICLALILGARPPAGIRRTAESATVGFPDARSVDLLHAGAMTDKDRELAELDTLRSEWREALLAAREALRAEEGVLSPEELDAHERHLRGEYETAAAELRQFAHDEGLPTELAEPFLPRGIARRALGLPKKVRSCVFELDDVLVGSSGLHREAWAHTLNELLAARSDTSYGRLSVPFDPRADYSEHIDGRPRLEGVRAFLASRGIRLPEGQATDPPGKETVHGLANHKNEWLGRLLEQRGVGAFDGVRHYLELAHDAGISCAVVSASAHTDEMLERSGLKEFVDGTIDAENIAADHLRNRPAPDRLLAACRTLRVEPERAAAFETSPAGVAAARAAGFAWVVAIDPAGDEDRLGQLRRAGADVAARGLGGLLGR